MSFAALNYLLALPLCGLPVLVHLWHKRHATPIRWPLMELLIQAESSSRSARRLKDVLLMLLRILLLLLIVLAFSRPILHVRPAGLLGALTQSSAVIVLDASMSMQDKRDGKSQFKRAQELAAKVAENLKGGRIEFMLLDGKLNSVANTQSDTFGNVVQAIRDAEVTYDTADLTAALQRLDQQAQETGHPTDIYLVTDNQATSWNDRSSARNEALRKLTERVRVSLVLPGQHSPSDGESEKEDREPSNEGNASIVDLVGWPHEIADTDAPIQFRVEVANFGPARAVDVQLRIAETPVGTTRLDLSAWGQGRAIFEHQFDEPGLYVVEAEITDEGLDADNRRWLVVEAPETIPVLCFENRMPGSGVSSVSETAFLRSFLSPETGRETARNRLFQPRLANLDELQDLPDDFRGIIVIANVPQLDEEQTHALTSLVESGASAAFFLGPDVSVEDYNRDLFRDGWGLLPAKLLPATGENLAELDDWNRAWHVDTSKLEHAMFRYAGSDEQRAIILRSVRFSKAFEVDDSALDGGTTETIARFSNGRPFILEKRLDRGHVLLFTTGCDKRWGSLPLSNAIVFLDRCFRYLAATSLPRRNLQVGQSIVLDREATLEDALLLRPDNREVAIPAGNTDRGQPAFICEDTSEPGLYAIRAEKEQPDLFAVNVGAAESDLRPMTAAELQEAYPDFRCTFAAEGQDEQAELTAPRPVEIWHLLAFAALLITVIEIFVAKRLEPGPIGQLHP